MALDCIAVLIGHLLADTGIAAVVSTSIYNKRLPDSTDTGPPCIVVDTISDATDRDFPEIRVKKISIACYGATPNQERILHGLVSDKLISGGTSTVYQGGMILAAYQDDSDGGEVDGVDENVGWPFVVSKWEIHFMASP